MIAPNRASTDTAVSIAPARARLMAAAKLAWTAAPKRRPWNSSIVKACTVWMALSVSPAMPLESATRSWAARDRPRTRRPMTMRGTTTAGTSSRIMPISRGLVMASITTEPDSWMTLRRAMEMPEPAMDWIRVVSVVIRDRTSPVCVTSKKVGSRRRMRRYTAWRMSATTRSPSQFTR